MALASGRNSIAICDRCREKYDWRELKPDGNSTGLKVCHDCADTLDPWRLPAPNADPVALLFARPDRDLGVEQAAMLLTEDYVYALADGVGSILEYA